jgi:hypothetical protein
VKYVRDARVDGLTNRFSVLIPLSVRLNSCIFSIVANLSLAFSEPVLGLPGVRDLVGRNTCGGVIKDPDRPLGSHVFVLMDAHDGHKGMVWPWLGHHSDQGVDVLDAETALIRRISADKAMIAAMTARMHRGMVLVTTDLPTHPDTRTNNDFVVMTDGDGLIAVAPHAYGVRSVSRWLVGLYLSMPH